MEGMLHLKVLRSPHAHARIVSIDKSAALEVPGVHAVFTWEDVPRKLYTTSIHEDFRVDPNDTYMLDNVVRFVGQRVAAVVAESRPPPRRGAERSRSSTRSCRPSSTPRRRCEPAPAVHDKGGDAFIRNPERNILIEVHGGVGDVEAGFAEADVIHEGTYSTHRGQHAHLETHCSIAWVDEDKRLNVRTTSQSPFICRDKLCYLVRPWSARRPRLLRARRGRFRRQAGGAHRGPDRAGRHEDRPAGAVGVHARRAVRRQHLSHPMRTTVKLGAKQDGTLTGIQLRIVSNTGAYGNHGGETLYHACSEAVALYRCPNKKIDAYTVYTNTVPSGAIRGYGVTQTIYAVECAMDELARALGMDPFELRQRNVVKPGDAMVSLSEEASDAEIGSYGLDQCVDIVRGALARGNGVTAPDGDDWLIGRGIAYAMHDTAPPPSIAPRPASVCWRTDLRAGYRHGGVRQRHHHPTCPDRRHHVGNDGVPVHIVQSDTDRTGFDTGRLCQHRHVCRQQGGRLAAEALRERILDFAARNTQVPREMCRLDDDAVICGEVRLSLADLRQAAEEAGHLLALSRKAYGSPRSVAFNVHGFRIAVHRVTGEIAILQSVHAADAGTVINPMQLHGQVEGAISQGIGWALYERIVIDETGTIVNPQFRNYRIPAYADIPRTEVYFADTCDSTGPLGAKGMGECPINPVAPALANALEDATGIRFRDLPFRPDLIYRPIFEKHGAAWPRHGQPREVAKHPTLRPSLRRLSWPKAAWCGWNVPRRRPVPRRPSSTTAAGRRCTPLVQTGRCGARSPPCPGSSPPPGPWDRRRRDCRR